MYYPEFYSSAGSGDSLWDDLMNMYLAGSMGGYGGGGWSDPSGGYWPSNPTYYNPQVYGQTGYYDPTYEQYMASYFSGTNPADYQYDINAGTSWDWPINDVTLPPFDYDWLNNYDLSIGGSPYTSITNRGVNDPNLPYNPGVVNPRGIPGSRTSTDGRTGGTGGVFSPNPSGGISWPNINLPGISINNIQQPQGQSSFRFPFMIPIPFGVSGNDPIDSSQLQDLINTMLGSTYPNYMQGLNDRDWYSNWLNSTLTGNYPNEATNLMRDFYNQNIQQGTSMMGAGNDYLMNQFFPQMMQNVNYLNQYGLPGNQLLQSQMNAIYPAANSLLGGTGQGYGVSDLISQIMSQGLPNQGAVEGIVSPLLGYGMGQMQDASKIANQLSQGQGVMTPEQQSLLSSLMGLTKTGGLTPEYVDAMTNLVYNPTQETLLGNLNKMGGGQALLTSPVNAELQRRGMRDFQDLLLTKGFANQPQYASLASGMANQAIPQGAAVMNALGNLGATGLGYGLQGFNTVANSVYPYASLGGNLATNLIGQGTNMFNSLGNLGLQNLQTINSLALTPYLTGQQSGAAGAAGYQNLQNQYLNYLLQNLGAQNQYTLGTNQLAGNQLQNVGNWLTQMYQTQAQQNLANQQAKWNALGMAIPGIIAGAMGQQWPTTGGTTGGRTTTTRGGRTTNPQDVIFSYVPDYMQGNSSIASRSSGR